MRNPNTTRPTVFISHSAGVDSWVRQFEREISNLGFQCWTAYRARNEPRALAQTERCLRESHLVVAVVDPNSASNTAWVEFEVGAALAMRKDVWLVTPEPPAPGSLAHDRFAQLERAVGVQHLDGSPGDIVRRLTTRFYQAKAS